MYIMKNTIPAQMFYNLFKMTERQIFNIVKRLNKKTVPNSIFFFFLLQNTLYMYINIICFQSYIKCIVI